MGGSGPEVPQVGEAARSLFCPGSESPLESLSSEISLSGGSVVNREYNYIKTTNRDTDDYEGLLCYIKFLQWGGAIIFGDIVAGGARLCMTRSGECTTASHACLKVFLEELPEGNDRIWISMD